MGGDYLVDIIGINHDISIRTPAWGVTRVLDNALGQNLISIRTPAWGVTTRASAAVRRYHFNSHPRVGGDQLQKKNTLKKDISIRTPAWGVTAKIHKTVFNHLYIFAALCAFCSEITQQKAIIIRILKENTSIHCADLPENYARL